MQEPNQLHLIFEHSAIPMILAVAAALAVTYFARRIIFRLAEGPTPTTEEQTISDEEYKRRLADVGIDH